METATRLVPLKTPFALSVLWVLACATAVAGPQKDVDPVTHTAKVTLTDLDLSTPEGRNTARERLRQTSRHLCATVADELDLSHQANYVACVEKTLAAALRSLEQPTVASASNQRTPTNIASRR